MISFPAVRRRPPLAIVLAAVHDGQKIQNFQILIKISRLIFFAFLNTNPKLVSTKSRRIALDLQAKPAKKTSKKLPSATLNAASS